MVAGVFGGLGEYFSIDANILRIIYVIIDVATGIVPCIIIYAASALILPVRPIAPKDDTVTIDPNNNNNQQQ